MYAALLLGRPDVGGTATTAATAATATASGLDHDAIERTR